ncbi:uncharacterized protein LOC142775507 [Rhipicephalus microplus]|uniref:uncharacterized protein LOC142775507 n=1 Tax=Rhipicephalus microplus TaxID=6941 RepID=UPI003F6BD1EE
MDREKFIALGQQLGLENEELREWVERECVEARDERAREREIAKENAERQQKLLEQQQKVQEQELKILELKLRLQESASRVQPMVADEQGGSSMSARGITEVCSPHKLIPPFNEARDDLDAYLQRFERVATCQGWPREKWALSLSLCMTAEALTVIGWLDPTAVLNYDQLKAALLQRFRYTAEGYREKFCKAKPEKNETGLQYAARLSGYFDRWLEVGKTETSFASLRDLMISEQFMKGCSPALRIFLKERSCKTLSSLCETADNFMEAQALTNLGRERIPKNPGPSVSKPVSAKKTEKPASRCFLCDKAGHRAADCWSRTKGNTFSRCGVCKQSGHSSDRCPGRKFCKDQASCMLSEKREDLTPEHHKSGYIVLQDGGTIPIVNATSSRRSANVGVADMPVVEGFLEDRPVHVLRDTGCNTVVVRQSLVPKQKFTGTMSPVYLLDRTVRYLPEAKVLLQCTLFTGEVLVKCMTDPLYDVILGNIKGAALPDTLPMNESAPQHDHGHVETRRAPCTDSSKGNAVNGEQDVSGNLHATQPRSNAEEAYEPPHEAMEKRPLPEEVLLGKAGGTKKHTSLPVMTLPALQVRSEALKKYQVDDETLRKCFEAVGKKIMSNDRETVFFIRDGTLFRKHNLPDGTNLEQLVVPRQLREVVLKLAHEGILAGHQGITKTVSRVTGEFYWPGVQSDTKRFVKSCDICQRMVPRHLVGRAPLGTTPIIETPFTRVGIDIIGLLSPTSEKGNRYVLTMIDFATRYPDAVALPSIEARQVAEGLLEMFSHVGIPKEIISDRGTSFMSAVMKEFSRLLSFKQLPTTPYHPMANGLIERFNGTLKRMIGRMCQERPKTWDRYIGPLLFAYRELPQFSTGSSPFELLYGRYVRGPMAVLKELWTNPRLDDETKTTYTHMMELRQRLERTCALAHKELMKAKKLQKGYYDKKARQRELVPGDQVLVLLPADANKLVLSWKGPFPVIEKRSELDYLVNLCHKVTLFHINMLKKYEERKPLSQRTVGGVTTTLPRRLDLCCTQFPTRAVNYYPAKQPTPQLKEKALP